MLAGVVLGRNMGDSLEALREAVREDRAVRRESRKWSAMSGYFADSPLDGEDPLIYEVFTWIDGKAETNMLATITVLYPGRIGGEHFHTKGHYHLNPDGSEFVVGYWGEGVLETAPREGSITETPIRPGSHFIVPSGHAHRVVNRSLEPVVYLSISSAGVGHDYAGVVACGWRIL